jgi:uncharacterized membrane protein required for colicin V production
MMFAAAPTTLTGPNWWDLVLTILLGIGLFRGRKRGMSEELLDLVKSVATVVLAGMGYKAFGTILRGYTGLPVLTMYIAAYVLIAIGIKVVFGLLKRAAGEKLLGSDTFGPLEYYLGMASGVVRWFCGVFTVLALLHGWEVTDAEYNAKVAADKALYGDDFFTFFTVGYQQRAIFRHSASGPFIKQYGARWLIEPTPMGSMVGPGEGLGRQREREVNDVMRSR